MLLYGDVVGYFNGNDMDGFNVSVVIIAFIDNDTIKYLEGDNVRVMNELCVGFNVKMDGLCVGDIIGYNDEIKGFNVGWINVGYLCDDNVGIFDGEMVSIVADIVCDIAGNV